MDNPDHALVRSFIASEGAAVPIATNPLIRSLGASLTGYDPVGRSITIAFDTVGAPFRQGAGVVLGGIVAGMLDIAMAFAAMTELELGTGFSTTSLTANFLGPARAEHYVATARIQKSGRRVIFLEASLADTQPVATATSTLLVSAAASVA